MYLALYRRFRPETFDRVLGQEHIVKILMNQLRSESVGHAYLFCGTRGTGKTTMARLLAKGVNCLSEGEKPCGRCAHCIAIRDGVFVDVIEIDAASNNGVENIRELRESVKYPPSVGRRKVYIVDEVHMLSAGAFNALLKTLEEPPENVMFVLATTERQKLPATILSRCLRLDFKRVPAETVKRGMRDICAELGVGIAEDALALLASNADGSVRDGLSLLDQCVSGAAGEITRDTVLELLGSPGEDGLVALTDMIFGGDIAGALRLLDRLLAEGADERQLMKDWIEHFRNLMLLRHLKKPQESLNMSVENIERLRAQSERLTPAFVNDGIFALAGALNDARQSMQPRVLLEVEIVRMASPQAPAEALAPPAKAPPPAEAPTPPPAKAPPRQAKPAPQAPAEALAPPQAKAPAPTEALAPLDWRVIVAEAAKKSPMLARLTDRNRSALAETGEKVFVIEVFDNVTKQTAEAGRDLLEAAATRSAGRPLRMDCRLNKGGSPRNPAEVPAPAAAPPQEEEAIQESFLHE
ncbi:MAG: DNA polymerase III subunit gamma/tau [Clostridiales Family XIII bacterium]|nr:DNA polymerase III subunit gamma/tau [Clostridiales Family XIII bacterium]